MFNFAENTKDMTAKEMLNCKAERCVSCGEIIPEGRRICPNCEKRRAKIYEQILIDFGLLEGGGEG